MNFDWGTFFLELVNFGALLWILKHFLYRPVLSVVDARRQQIEANLAAAEKIRRAALAEHETARCERESFEAQTRSVQAALDRELAEVREKRLAELTVELDELRAKNESRERRERDERNRQAELGALALGGQFTSTLLRRLASPDLESRLLGLVLEDLPHMGKAEAELLRAALAGDGVEVSSAFPLADAARQALADALDQAAGQSVRLEFHEDPALLAGLCIRAKQWRLSANLAEELRFFQELAARRDV